MKSIKRKYVVAAVLCLFFFTVGCGSGRSRTQVQGKVTYRGKSVGEQTLTLQSQGAQKEFFTHKIPIFDGAFSGQGPAPGVYKVVIEESLSAQEGHKPTGGTTVEIPKKYRSAATTDLTWALQAGENNREIELTD